MTAPSENPVSTPPTGLVHGLRWGLKKSFIDYVRRMPDGRGSVGNGAVPVGTGDLFYEYDAATTAQRGDGLWAFRGDVRFTGHYGMLFVRVANPWIEVDGTSAVLTIEDPDSGTDGPRLPLVTSTLERIADRDGTHVWGSRNVELTAYGVTLFNDVYAEGEPFEPLVIQVPAPA